MKAKVIEQHNGAKTYVLICEKGDEFSASMQAFAKQHELDAAHFTAIGAFSSATLGYFDRASSSYRDINVDEQVEVLSLVGDIADHNGQPKIHAHVVVGKADGTTRGGHILEAHIWPTLEIVLTETPAQLKRTSDAETGLALINLDA